MVDLLIAPCAALQIYSWELKPLFFLWALLKANRLLSWKPNFITWNMAHSPIFLSRLFRARCGGITAFSNSSIWLSDCSCSSAPQVCHWFNVRMAVLWTTNPMQSMCPSVLGQDIELQVAPKGIATGLWMHVCQWSLFPISRWQVEVDVVTSSSVWITDYVCTHTIFPIRFLYSQQQLGYSVRM